MSEQDGKAVFSSPLANGAEPMEKPNHELEPIKATEQEPEKEKPIDPKLIEKLDACKLLSLTHKILENGIFPGGMAPDLDKVMSFVRNMHGPLLKECEAHVDFLRLTNPKEYDRQQAEKKKDEVALKKAEEKRERKGILKRLMGNA